jgi:hypothetical protein
MSNAADHTIVLQQTTHQSVRNRFYKAMCNVLIALVPIVAAGLIGIPNAGWWLPVIAILGGTLFVTAWLLLIDGGAGHQASQVIRASPEGLAIQRYDDTVHLNWTDIIDIKVSWHPLRRIRLRVGRWRHVDIDYYSLTHDQRRYLLPLMRERLAEARSRQ